MTLWINIITMVTMLGAALMAGTFFGFSTFIMQGLGQLRPAGGIEAMQSINRTVINPLTMGVFIGTAVLGLLLVGHAAWDWQQPGAAWRLAGGLCYALGTFGVTGTRNVPLNEALDRVAADSEQGESLWQDYLKRWVFWNHVRTLAGAAATVALALGLPTW